jgi:hypothetical protein
MPAAWLRRDAWRWRSVRSRHRRPMAGYTFEVGAGAVVGVGLVPDEPFDPFVEPPDEPP